jgi:hypothetical protein
MGWKKMLIGEKMPDKDDPQYRKRYEDEVNAGRKFAQMTRIDKVAGKLQHFAIGHQKAFLIIVFGFIAFSFSLNIYRMGRVWSFHQTATSAIEQQDEMLRNRHKRIKEAISSNHVNAEIHGKNKKTNKDNDGHTEED